MQVPLKQKYNVHKLHIIFKNSIGFHTIDDGMTAVIREEKRDEGKNVNICGFLGSLRLYRMGLPYTLLGQPLTTG